MKKRYWTNEEEIKLKEMYDAGIDISDICIMLDRTYSSVTSKAVTLNLQTKNIKQNNPKYKAIYQDYDWCYEHFISLGMSHQEMADLSGCKKRTIEKWCTEIHRLDTYARINKKTLNNRQQDLIIGSLLGDGHIDKREKFPLFIVSHAENQKDYLYYKYEIMKDLCRMTPTKYNGEEKTFSNGKTYMCQDSYRFNTGSYYELDKYRKLSKLSLVKMLNEYSFAIWILDDAYHDKSKNLWELCSAMMNREENELALQILKEKFSIIGHVEKDSRYIQFDVPSSRTINEIILRNIPNELDVIQCKIFTDKKVG